MRQLTGDIYPGSGYGLNSPTSSGALDGAQGSLSSDGKNVFPYLKGPVGMDTGTYGYEATPLATQVAGASFDPLVQGPNGSALVGVYTHPERRPGNGGDASTRTSISCRPSSCATVR